MRILIQGKYRDPFTVILLLRQDKNFTFAPGQKFYLCVRVKILLLLEGQNLVFFLSSLRILYSCDGYNYFLVDLILCRVAKHLINISLPPRKSWPINANASFVKPQLIYRMLINIRVQKLFRELIRRLAKRYKCSSSQESLVKTHFYKNEQSR